MGKLYMISATGTCCLWLAICCMLFWSVAIAQSSDYKICSSLDIRNKVESFKILEDCTVIEGYLHILLMDKTTSSSFKNITFPKLIEIRDYLLLYRVQGLQSIGKLFPNLSIIRGAKLFYNYALVIYDMPNLKEVGLGNMTDILRGSVRIERNPYLCYIETIDWDLIARIGKNGHFIKDNQNVEDCHDVCLHNGNQNLCPFSEEKQIHLCWNRYSCQKVCSRQCEEQNRTCAHPTGCCHSQCLGGCTGSTDTDCIACRNVRHQGKCQESCPSSKFQYNGRCISKAECENLPSPKSKQNNHFKAWKIERQARSGQCSLECPPGFESVGLHGCRKCERFCSKVCDKMKIDNLATAQKLHHCTAINGSLTIQLSGSGSNIYQELERFLGRIETVDGYVKIIHSLPLISLDFLRNLTLIKGNELDRNEYSLIVRGNDNLEEMWSQRKNKLTIRRGKPFFHFNPKLCLSKIKGTLENTGISNWSSTDISTTSNGNKGACDRVNMILVVNKTRPTAAFLSFNNFRKSSDDARTILSYVISYREVEPGQKVSLFEGRDACSDGNWKVEDVDASDTSDTSNTSNEDNIIHVIYDLVPDTSYAIHVRTSVIDSEQKSGYSDIKYFRTEPDIPTSPVDLTVTHVSEKQIDLKWRPPLKPNGKVTEYHIFWVEEKLNKDAVWMQNFCEDLSITLKKKPRKKQEPKVPFFQNVTMDNNMCPCPKTKKLDEAKIKEQIKFENFIHNAVYTKRSQSSTSRSKRSIIEESAFKNSLSTLSPTTSSPEDSLSSISPTVTTETIRFFAISDKPSFSVENLHHYTKYHIQVKACHNHDHDAKVQRCSSPVNIYPRSKPIPEADNIDINTLQSRIDNQTTGVVHIRWKPPSSPNGIIDGYQVEYKRVDIENFKPITVCITQGTFLREKGHSLKGLQPGKYSMRLQAISLAGKGNWTNYKYFEIKKDETGLETYIIIIVVIIPIAVIVVSIGLGMWVYLKRKYNASIAASSLFTSVNPEYVSTFEAYVPDEWEVPRENVTLLHELGQGTFGMVYEGVAKDPKTDEEFKCAIKTVNKSSSVREFLKEASVMKAFICHHVVRLKGVVSIMQPTLVIMELMENGDLRNYLRSQRPDYESVDGTAKNPPTVARFIQMAAEIADGMDYLASNKFVHRDLAARNCMVAKDLTVKIGDFGMTRDIYETDYYRKGGKGMLPVRWMAPESLKDGVFTSHSDVWSYGVVLWEMVTLACQPYQGLANEQVLKYVIDGGIIETPINCDTKLYEIMCSCWQYTPKLRPTFKELVECLLFGVSDSFKRNAFYFNKDMKQENPSESEDEELLTPSTPLHNNSNQNGSAAAALNLQKPSESGKLKGVSGRSGKNSNRSSNGYVPCDNTGSTYC